MVNREVVNHIAGEVHHRHAVLRAQALANGLRRRARDVDAVPLTHGPRRVQHQRHVERPVVRDFRRLEPDPGQVLALVQRMPDEIARDGKAPRVLRRGVLIVERVDPLFGPHRVRLDVVALLRPGERQLVGRSVGVQAEGRHRVIGGGDHRLARVVLEGRCGRAGGWSRRDPRSSRCRRRRRSCGSRGRWHHHRRLFRPGAGDDLLNRDLLDDFLRHDRLDRNLLDDFSDNHPRSWRREGRIECRCRRGCSDLRHSYGLFDDLRFAKVGRSRPNRQHGSRRDGAAGGQRREPIARGGVPGSCVGCAACAGALRGAPRGCPKGLSARAARGLPPRSTPAARRPGIHRWSS